MDVRLRLWDCRTANERALRGWLWWGRLPLHALVAGRAASLEQLFVLLFLVAAQYRFDLLIALAHDAAHFCSALARRQRWIGPHVLQLLLAIGKERLDLAHLVGAEAELFAQTAGLASGIGRSALRRRRTLRGGCAVILGLSGILPYRKARGQAQSQQEHSDLSGTHILWLHRSGSSV